MRLTGFHCAGLFVSVVLLLSCERLTLPPRPEGVAVTAKYFRHDRLWINRTDSLEQAFYGIDGSLAYEFELKSGIRSGQWRSFAPPPNQHIVVTDGQYRNGHRIGDWHFFDDLGRGYITIPYTESPVDLTLSALSPDIGNENGQFRRLYPDGSIELKGNYVAGKFDGLFVRYSRTGKLQFEGKYNKGLKQGLWKIYDSNGKLHREESYQNGKVEGVVALYKDGLLWYITKYKDNIEIGPRQWF